MSIQFPVADDSVDVRQLPVSLSDLKDHLRIEHGDQDRLLLTKLQAAVAEVEQAIGAAIVARTFALSLDSFPTSSDCPPDRIMIPNPPLRSVVDIKYFDEDDVEQTLDSANYRLSKAMPYPYIGLSKTGAWPDVYDASNAVTVRYVAGWCADASSCPHQLREAVLMRAATRVEMPVETGLGASIWGLQNDVNVVTILRPFYRPSV